MTFEELQEFITLQDARLRDAHERVLGVEQRSLARMVKLSEEMGELAAEVLSQGRLQRKEKLESRDPHALDAEVADVIITTFLLARTLGVNVEDALRAKIEKLNARYR